MVTLRASTSEKWTNETRRSIDQSWPQFWCLDRTRTYSRGRNYRSAPRHATHGYSCAVINDWFLHELSLATTNWTETVFNGSLPPSTARRSSLPHHFLHRIRISIATPIMRIPSPITSSSDSPLCTSITPSLFHSRLKSYLFHKSYPLSFTSSSRTAFTDICLHRFFWATRFLILIFSLFFVSGPCSRLSWPSRQLLSARKFISYRIASYRMRKLFRTFILSSRTAFLLLLQKHSSQCVHPVRRTKWSCSIQL